MNEIQLGDKVKCKHTGFTGIAVSRTEFINGCIQFCIVPKVEKDGKYLEEVCIDENSLVLVKAAKKEKISNEDDLGGPVTRGLSMRGF